MKKAVRQTHLRGPRKAKRGIIDPGERSAATPTNKVLGKLPTRPPPPSATLPLRSVAEKWLLRRIRLSSSLRSSKVLPRKSVPSR